jgi:hypothetical protein
MCVGIVYKKKAADRGEVRVAHGTLGRGSRRAYFSEVFRNLLVPISFINNTTPLFSGIPLVITAKSYYDIRV